MNAVCEGNSYLKKVENFLKGYQLNRKFLEMDRYEKQFMNSAESEETTINEVEFAKPRMLEVRRFIMGLDNCDEKLFLYYHYVRGESVENCAELLGIARSTGYRLKKRALNLAARMAVQKKIF